MTGTRCMWRMACLSMLLAMTCLHGQAPRAEAEEPPLTAATAVEGAAEETSAPASRRPSATPAARASPPRRYTS